VAKARRGKETAARGAVIVRTKIVKVNEPPLRHQNRPAVPSDKLLDLVKWIDTRSKLATVIILGVLGLVAISPMITG